MHVLRLTRPSLWCALLLGACQPKAAPAPLTVAQSEGLSWIRAHAPGTAPILTLPALSPHVLQESGRPAYPNDAQALAWWLGAEPAALQDAMTGNKVDLAVVSPWTLDLLRENQRDPKTAIPDLLTGPPDDPNVREGAAFQRSTLYRLAAMYGTGTRDSKCIEGLQLVAGSKTLGDLGGRHTPEVQVYKRVPGAHVMGKALVPGSPVRMLTGRKVAGQLFVFVCQSKVAVDGTLDMRWPYPSEGTKDVEANGPTQLWIGVDKTPQEVQITAADVDEGRVVVVDK